MFWQIENLLMMNSRQRNLLIVGGSRGIGAAACEHFVVAGDNVISVSRTPSTQGHWVQADISTKEGLALTTESVQEIGLDALLFLGDTWEVDAFTDDYHFENSTTQEIQKIIAVNLTAPILLARSLWPTLAQSTNPQIILMGSTSGLPGRTTGEVAYTASKSGLRGAADALRASMPRCGVTIINPANVGTEEVKEDMEKGYFKEQLPIPLRDIVNTIDFILSLSSVTTVEEITVSQRYDGHIATANQLANR